MLLAREPLRFVHPLVRKAIERDVPASERATRHLEAAQVLYGEGAGVERVAAHLLMGRSQGDPWVVERLRVAAREARARGGMQSAIRYLKRALAEPLGREERGEVLAELGVVEAAIAAPAAAEHLTAALASTSESSRRAALSLELGRALAGQGLHEPAAHAFDQGLRELAFGPADPADEELRGQLDAGFLAAATMVPSLHDRADGRASDLLSRVPDAVGTQGQRLLLAQAALQAVHRGQPAQEVITLEPPYDLEDAIRLYALAELHRSQGGLEEALSIAVTAGEVAEQMVPFLDHCPWRSCATLAALALGERQRARELAADALARAEHSGVPHQRIQALRLAGLSEGGASGLEQLRAAVELARSLPPRLETIRALIDLGAALRRANQRSAARPPLEQAADLARQGGAHALHQRARTELSASGARPRRDALLSGPASLTPSERRIAELAAEGNSNREIAATLFVTPKTVEYHLRNAYRKPDIQTRHELTDALRGEVASAS